MSIVKATRRSVPWTAALASATCLLAVGAASAAEATVRQHCTVNYRDLDLSTPAGAKTLYIRIQRAAHDVCGYTDLADIHQAEANRQCRGHAIADAVYDVHSPLLTALYNKTKPRLTAMNVD